MWNWLAKMLRPSAVNSGGQFLRRRVLRARYDAAATTPDNGRHWANADGLSANAANNPNVRCTLRNRARYEVANNSYARGIVLTLANDVVGTGPRLQMLTGDAAANRLVEREFAKWSAAVPPQDTDSLYHYTVHGVGSHRLLLRADGTIGLGAAQLERYWYVAGDRLVLCSWTEDAVHLRQQRTGVWKGNWIGFGKHGVTLELHRAQSIVDALWPHGGERLVGAEVGVLHGETSEHLLRSLPHRHLHMVDRWRKYPPSATPSSLKQANQGAFDTARRGAIQATEFAADRRTIHRQESVQAAASFDNGSLEFVVIDAEHGNESVVADITAWLPKLKPRGILFGHDYGHPRFPGVKRAFDQLLPDPPGRSPTVAGNGLGALAP